MEISHENGLTNSLCKSMFTRPKCWCSIWKMFFKYVKVLILFSSFLFKTCRLTRFTVNPIMINISDRFCFVEFNTFSFFKLFSYFTIETCYRKPRWIMDLVYKSVSPNFGTHFHPLNEDFHICCIFFTLFMDYIKY